MRLATACVVAIAADSRWRHRLGVWHVWQSRKRRSLAMAVAEEAEQAHRWHQAVGGRVDTGKNDLHPPT
jgi:hypothetical protein